MGRPHTSTDATRDAAGSARRQAHAKEGSMTVPATLDTVAVVGNGRVGHGIAQIFAAAGHRVVMIGRREESLAAAMDRIAKSFAAFEAHGLVTSGDVSAALGRIRASTELEDAAEAQLVLEAVPADRAVQDEVYGRLDAILRAAGGLRLRERAASERARVERHAPRARGRRPLLVPAAAHSPRRSLRRTGERPGRRALALRGPPGSRKGAGDRRQGGSGLHRQPASVRDPARGLGTVGGGGGVGRSDRHGGQGVPRAASG